MELGGASTVGVAVCRGGAMGQRSQPRPQIAQHWPGSWLWSGVFPQEQTEQDKPSPTSETGHLCASRAVPRKAAVGEPGFLAFLWVPGLPLMEEWFPPSSVGLS